MITLKEMINKAGLEVAKYYLNNICEYISHIWFNFNKREWETYVDGTYFSEEEWAKISELKRIVEEVLKEESISDETIKEILFISKRIKNMESIELRPYFKESDLIDAQYVFDYINNKPVFKEKMVGIKENYFSWNFFLFQFLLAELLEKYNDLVELYYFIYKIKENYEEEISEGIFVPFTLINVFTTELSSRYIGSEIKGHLGEITWWKQIHPHSQLHKKLPYFVTGNLGKYYFRDLSASTPEWENKISTPIYEINGYRRLRLSSSKKDICDEGNF